MSKLHWGHHYLENEYGDGWGINGGFNGDGCDLTHDSHCVCIGAHVHDPMIACICAHVFADAEPPWCRR